MQSISDPIFVSRSRPHFILVCNCSLKRIDFVHLRNHHCSGPTQSNTKTRYELPQSDPPSLCDSIHVLHHIMDSQLKHHKPDGELIKAVSSCALFVWELNVVFRVRSDHLYWSLEAQYVSC
jgi:hypothetical protein